LADRKGEDASVARSWKRYVTEAEFQAAFDEHKDAVYRLAWRMCGSTRAAEDITQEVFMALLRDPDRFDPVRGRLRAFLLGIARNVALKHWRAEHRFEPLDGNGAVIEPFDIERGEIGEIVGRAVRALPPLQREVVILAEYEGLTLSEIAHAVDANIGTVKSRLHRARENLRRILEPLYRRHSNGT
jgi:RNA polymerase sigma-70 factor (ECF subfamily)